MRGGTPKKERWPYRLYVIDREGRIAHKSTARPLGFKPEVVGKTLENILGKQE